MAEEKIKVEEVKEEVIKEEEVTPEDDALDKFKEAMPEFADVASELDTETKGKMLIARAAQIDGNEPVTSRPDPVDGEDTKPQTPTSRYAEELSLMEPEVAVNIAQEFCNDVGADEAATKKLTDVLYTLAHQSKALAEKVGNSFIDIEGRAVAPMQWQAAMTQVEGSTTKDVTEAKKAIASGEVVSFDKALKLAVFERESVARKPLKPRPHATSIAEAILANQLTGGGPRDGGPINAPDFSEAGLMAQMEKEESEKQAK